MHWLVRSRGGHRFLPTPPDVMKITPSSENPPPKKCFFAFLTGSYVRLCTGHLFESRATFCFRPQFWLHWEKSHGKNLGPISGFALSWENSRTNFGLRPQLGKISDQLRAPPSVGKNLGPTSGFALSCSSIFTPTLSLSGSFTGVRCWFFTFILP